jgi:hypothetical protein
LESVSSFIFWPFDPRPRLNNAEKVLIKEGVLLFNYFAALLFNTVAYRNVCIVEPVTVSHMRGQMFYVDNETKFAAGNEVTVEPWQTDANVRNRYGM